MVIILFNFISLNTFVYKPYYFKYALGPPLITNDPPEVTTPSLTNDGLDRKQESLVIKSPLANI